MEKIKNFILEHLDDILIVVCLLLSILFSSFLKDIMDRYNITTWHSIMITGFTVISVTFLDTAFQTLKHKSRR